MIRKTISMPDAMGAFIEARVKSGLYGNDSEYFRDLVRKDQAREKAVIALQAAIDEGMESGDGQLTMAEIFDAASRRAAAEAAR